MARSRRRTAALAFAAVAIAGGGVAAETVMQPGAWQLQVTITPYNPQTGAPLTRNETTTVVCFTREFLAKTPYLSATLDEERMLQSGATCATADFVKTGNSASWRMSCSLTDGKRIDMTIKNRAEPRRLTSEMRQRVTDGSGTVPIDMVTTGTFVGECTGDMIRP